jgi:phosphopantothenoylcysteine decarboxylase/phosphopantothenate--cysteine ligase
VDRLKGHITVVEPSMEEGKAKAAEPRNVLDAALSVLSKGPLAGKRVLVTAGSTIEYIDPIRVVTNTSSGKMGIAIVQEAERMGAAVTLVYGHGSEPANGRAVRVNTSEEMYRAVVSQLSSKKYDVAIMAAAVADFTPAKKSEKKIDTRAGRMELSLVPTKKIIDEVKKKSKNTFLVAFKADFKVPVSLLVEKAYKKLQESGADIVVANDLGRKGSEAGSDRNEVFIVDRKKKVVHLSIESKPAIARKLLEIVAESVNRDYGRK